ncbi:MAG TPA: DUF72 domain-containing protein [Gemmatimonadaceae bacterium]|nr:DUF72 domain-containing protein [Gemmatimonadaceae bacterium]
MDDAHDPGTTAGSERAEAVRKGAVQPITTARGTSILIGVASWTDPSMTATGVFYPVGVSSPEARLRYYASRFPLVEVDSTYYAIPARRSAELWVERTPPGFVFDAKAHALMTGQPSEVNRLPGYIRDALPERLAKQERVYATDLPDEVRDEVWLAFLDALSPLRESGRMGSLLLQFPRWFTPTRASAALLEDAARRLDGWRTAVEFRNREWFSDRLRKRTLALLQRNGLVHVVVDAPPGFESSVPAVPAATSRALAVVRFHGRNTNTWEAKVTRVSDRFRYFYDREQLRGWLPLITAITEQSEEVHLVFNNCYGNYATTNALEMASMILDAGL